MVSAAEQLASNLNFGAFAKAEDLKKRIWFTLAALVVYRLGTYIPIPGINPAAFAESFKAQSSGILGMFNNRPIIVGVLTLGYATLGLVLATAGIVVARRHLFASAGQTVLAGAAAGPWAPG